MYFFRLNISMVSIISILSMSTSCRTTTPNSDSQGHFENFSEVEYQKFKGKLSTTPQYSKKDAVVLDQRVESELLANILNTEIENVYIIVHPGFIDGMPLDELRKNFAQYHNNELENSMLTARINIESMKKVKFLEREPSSDDNTDQKTDWVRDYGPISVIHNESKSPYFVEFNYFSYRKNDDSVPSLLSKNLNVPRISLPLYNEGGNFMIDEHNNCMMTERVVELNAVKNRDDDIIFSQKEVEQAFKDYLGCSKVHIFPKMPEEPTGHIDIWAKFLGNKNILLSSVKNETLEISKNNPTNHSILARIKKFLDDRKNDFEKLGYNVILVPQPTIENGEAGYIVRSYTNSLIIGKKALVPKYKKLKFIWGSSPYQDESLLIQYEKEVIEAYTRAGYSIEFIEADKLIERAGAIHCTTKEL